MLHASERERERERNYGKCKWEHEFGGLNVCGWSA